MVAAVAACACAHAAQAAAVGNGRIALGASGGGRADIVTVKPNGTGWTNLTPGDHPAYCSPAWSPDGTKIAFVEPRPPPPQATDAGGLVVMNADGSDVRTITLAQPYHGCVKPAWSPNGRWIAYKTGGTDIDAIRSSGVGAPLTVTDGAGGYWDPAWSHDGSRIAYNGEDGHVYTTAVTSVAGTPVFGSKQRVDVDGLPGVRLDWSPDDTRFVGEVNTTGIWTSDSVTGGSPVQVTVASPDTDPGWHDFMSSWSPDGRRIVFERGLFGSTVGSTASIYTVDSGGGTPVELTGPVGGYVAVGDPDWQPLPHG